MALNSTTGIGINGETKLDDCLWRFASCEQTSQFVDATLDKMFFGEDCMVEPDVITLRETTIGVTDYISH
jgi:hypothetical protein